MYSTYKKQSYEEKWQTVKKKLEKELEIEAGALADLKCVTVFSLYWGHAFHLFLLLKQQNINTTEMTVNFTQDSRSYLIRKVFLNQF